LGGDVAMAVCEMSSAEAATAFARTVGSVGRAELRTTALMTPSEVDAATKIAAVYWAPGA
jgi:hypothetical protein